MNFYPHNIGDFAAETQFLDDASLGIFVRLLDRYMLTEKPIKTQWVSFAFQNERFEKAKRVLEALFEEAEDGWVYAPMVPVIESYRANAEKNRVNGRKGGRPRKSQAQTATQTVSTGTQSEPSGFLNKTQTEPKKSLTNNQEPITNIDNPLNPPSQGEAPDGASVKPKRKWQGLMTDRPDDVPAVDWDQWIQIRKLKKLPVTDLAIEKMRSEAKTAGLTLAQAVRKCIESGWGGFKACYLEQKQNVLPKADRLGTGNPDEYLPNSRLKRQECRVYKRGI